MSPEILAISVVILLFSVIIHEVMHGLVALKFGDHTAEHAGRLTLNPIPHIDLYGTIIVPLFLMISGLPIFGMAKPVPVNPLNFNNIQRGEFMVSVAGIAANFGLAVISTILFHISISLGMPLLIVLIFNRFIVINLYLGIFNLFPMPPLDGSKALLSILPYSMAREYQKLELYGIFVVLGLIFIPFFLHIPSPLIILLSFLVNLATNLLGVNLY